MIRTIPTQVHGVIDYLAEGTLLTASARVLRLAGGGAAIYSSLTDYELGAASGALLASSPWLFGFAKERPRYWLPHVQVKGVSIAGAALGTAALLRARS